MSMSMNRRQQQRIRIRLVLLLLVNMLGFQQTEAFSVVPYRISMSSPYQYTSTISTISTRRSFLEKQEYADSQIPEEFRKEIQEAEAKTPAAKDRGDRIFVYTSIGVVFLACALSSAIYGKVIEFENPDTNGFAAIEETLWFQASKSLPILSTKIGLYIDMALAGVCYFLVENEYVRKFNTQEAIWKEIVKRKEANMASGSSKKKKKKSIKMKGKKGNRMKALAEVIDVAEVGIENTVVPAPVPVVENSTESPVTEDGKQSDENGMLGKIKDFYSKADDMAATQALILNKKLEDAGVVEKITDETGLKVVGKDAAKKLIDEKSLKE